MTNKKRNELSHIKRLAGIQINEDIDPMVRRKVQYQKQVVVSAITLSSDDWQLYNGGSEESEKAARDINSMLVGILNSAHNRKQAQRANDKFIAPKYVKFGYDDTEPRQVLDEVFDIIYGEGSRWGSLD